MENKPNNSLYLKWFLLLFISGTISLLFFSGNKFLMENIIGKYYENEEYVQKNNKKYILKLQEYINQNNLSSKDSNKLDIWINDNKLIYIQIKKDDIWIYSSDYNTNDIEPDEYDYYPSTSEKYYNINFSDGPAQILIMGMYSYNTYMVALVFDIVISFSLFLVITMFWINKKIHYINVLSHDIEIIEGGNLEYDIHIQGNDEISDLAKGLNAMKTSFKNQIEEIRYLTESNQKMITEISHDLRTPLTSILLYAEIIQNEKYKNDEHRQMCIQKIIKKTQHLKDLSNKLLDYSVNPSDTNYIHAQYIPLNIGLYDEVSDMCRYLTEQGFNVNTKLQWKDGQIYVYEEYITRILDNISSNIIKYSDNSETITIWDEYPKNEMCIFFENKFKATIQKTDSYNIGIQNINMMIEEIGGNCIVEKDKNLFRLCLKFKYQK